MVKSTAKSALTLIFNRLCAPFSLSGAGRGIDGYTHSLVAPLEDVYSGRGKYLED